MPKNIEKVLNTLRSRKLENLLGFEEGLFFDAKHKNPYDLNDPNGRYELAKDVSSFANSEGGIIVIGLLTERIEDKLAERVNGIDLFSENEFEIGKYIGIINEYIYPKIIGIEISWINDSKNPGLGISYILVPKQDSKQKYFLIKKVFEDNELIKGIVFGVVIRNDSSSLPFTIDRLHKNIQNGISQLSEKINFIEDKIDILLEFSQKNKTESNVITTEEKLNRIIEDEEQ